MTVSIHGIGVSRGIAIGQAYIRGRNQFDIVKKSLAEDQIEQEIDRYRRAIAMAVAQLEQLRDRTDHSLESNVRSIINTHVLMLNDTAFVQDVLALIQAQQCNAEWALLQQRDALVKIFEHMEDDYLRSRKDDIYHISSQVLRNLVFAAGDDTPLQNSLANTIVIAHELSPAEIVVLHDQHAAGIISTSGGPLSHTSIMARSLGIPAVVGGRQCFELIRQGETTILDGESGCILFDADKTTIEHYDTLGRRHKERLAGLQKLKGRPAVTRDQHRITLQANIEQLEDIEAALELGIDGVGLYRTELLYLQSDELPSEELQLDNYTTALRLLKGKPLTIRTLDLGMDKQHATSLGQEAPANPALSLRGIRLCLQDLELFTPHLRAILRASHYGPVKIMLPMISTLHEILQFKNFLATLKSELDAQQIRFDQNIEIGGMIEVPAAALCARQYITHLDFLSVGTNDLIQYTLAIDRTDDTINYLYDPLHPAILRLVHEVIQAGRKHRKPVTMCGEMAGDPRLTRLLLSMGLRNFSMQAHSILEVKDVIANSDFDALQAKSEALTSLDTTARIVDHVEMLNRQSN